MRCCSTPTWSSCPGRSRRCCGALADDPRAVAAGGRLVDPQTLATQQQYRPRPFPTLANFLVIVLGIEELWAGNPVTRRYHGSELDDVSVQAVAQPAAAAILVRRDRAGRARWIRRALLVLVRGLRSVAAAELRAGASSTSPQPSSGISAAARSARGARPRRSARFTTASCSTPTLTSRARSASR